ncbi:hypothetical protein [Desulfovibrio sp.]|uniref:hypothetical protein n=1 Tax=Desulfovibrio sp. TaxID=885 RepID=UPI0025C5562E|nr:hypothetical protein [Desulfovibrio sp.]
MLRSHEVFTVAGPVGFLSPLYGIAPPDCSLLLCGAGAQQASRHTVRCLSHAHG